MLCLSWWPPCGGSQGSAGPWPGSASAWSPIRRYVLCPRPAATGRTTCIAMAGRVRNGFVLRHLLPRAGGARARQRGRFQVGSGCGLQTLFPRLQRMHCMGGYLFWLWPLGALFGFGASGAWAFITLRPAHRNGLHHMVCPCPPGLFHNCAYLPCGVSEGGRPAHTIGARLEAQGLRAVGCAMCTTEPGFGVTNPRRLLCAS